MASRLLHVLLFLLGMVGIAVGIHRVDPMPFWSWTRNKIGFLEQEIDQYDTLFLGSSRSHYGVVPEAFDRRMAELGKPTRSYSLALSGQRPHDFDELLHWLVARRPTRLKRVCIELCSWELEYRQGDWMATQELEMRTARTFLPRCRTILDSHTDVSERVSLLWHNAVHTLTNVLSIGQGARILGDRVARMRGEPLPSVYPPANAGFESVDDTKLEHQKRDHERFLANAADSYKELSNKVVNVAPEWLDGAFRADILRREIESLRALGIEPVLVVMPEFSCSFHGRAGVDALRQEVRVFEFDRPQFHRELYEYGYWWDRSHLCRKGAEYFSRYLAEQLCEAELLPFAQQPAPRFAAEAPVDLMVAWSADGTALEFEATRLPFVGTVKVMVAGSLVSDGNTGRLSIRVAQPASATAELQRSDLLVAKGQLASGWPQGQPLFAQVVVSIDGKVVAVSDPVRVEPR